MNPGLAVVLFVLGLFVVSIGLHEYGHYWTARRFGMRADKFFIGFGPTLWSTRRGETEMGVKALPLGGFVRIKGMSPADERLAPVADAVFDPEAVAADRRAVAAATNEDVTLVAALPDSMWDRLERELDERGVPVTTRRELAAQTRARLGDHPTASEARQAFLEVADRTLVDTGRVGDVRHRVLKGDEGRFFHDRPAHQRTIVLAAGSAMHFAQAAVLVFVSLVVWGSVQAQPVVDNVVAQVERNDTCNPQTDEDCLVPTPAAAVGLEVGDRIVSVAGDRVSTFDEVRAVVMDHPGEPLSMVVEHDGARRELTVTPRPVVRDGQTIGFLGFAPLVEEVSIHPIDALGRTFVGEGSLSHATVETVKALGRVFGPEGFGAVFSQVAGDQERNPEGAASPIGIARVTAEGARDVGPLFLIVVLASVNVFIGVFNLIPLPPLDGGHLAIVGVEKVVNGVRRRRGERPDFVVDPRTIATVAVPVVLLIGTMFLAVLWLDLVNPIQFR